MDIQPVENPTPAPDVEPGKENIGKLVGFLLLVALVVGFFIAASANAPKAVRGSTYNPPEERHTITYVVEGRGNVDITIENEFASTEQHTVKLPYSKEFKADSGQFVYLSAQKDSGGSGQITCLLLLDGQVAKKASTTAEYGICDVSGLVP